MDAQAGNRSSLIRLILIVVLILVAIDALIIVSVFSRDNDKRDEMQYKPSRGTVWMTADGSITVDYSKEGAARGEWLHEGKSEGFVLYFSENKAMATVYPLNDEGEEDSTRITLWEMAYAEEDAFTAKVTDSDFMPVGSEYVFSLVNK